MDLLGTAMQKQTYKEIDKDLLNRIKHDTWSIQSRDKNDGREKEYLGSQEIRNTIYDYYKDPAGSYWYDTRKRLPTGEIVSMEIYLFGGKMGSKRRG